MSKEVVNTGKLYHSISEVAKMFSVSNSLIRFWETEFDFLKPKKNRKGNRSYTQKDIDSIRIIYHLVKERGFTLEGARQEVKLNRNQVERKMDTISHLKALKKNLLDLQSKL